LFPALAARAVYSFARRSRGVFRENAGLWRPGASEIACPTAAAVLRSIDRVGTSRWSVSWPALNDYSF